MSEVMTLKKKLQKQNLTLEDLSIFTFIRPCYISLLGFEVQKFEQLIFQKEYKIKVVCQSCQRKFKRKGKKCAWEFEPSRSDLKKEKGYKN